MNIKEKLDLLCFAALYTYGGYIFESNQFISCLTKIKKQ